MQTEYSALVESEIKKVKQYIEINGGLVVDRIAKNTTDLIVKDVNSNSSKIQKALKKNILVSGFNQFIRPV